MAAESRVAARQRRKTVIQRECLEDIRYWVDTNRKVALRTLDLIEATVRDPYEGLGKPEHLKHFGGNVWSRRITDADRLVYEVFGDRVEFLQARYHY
jgi:toxin YoeB